MKATKVNANIFLNQAELSGRIVFLITLKKKEYISTYMKLDLYLPIVYILVIACCFTVSCDQMQKPMMDAIETATEVPAEPVISTEPEMMEDLYASLPEIGMSTELEPGKYRIAAVGSARGNFKFIYIGRLIGDSEDRVSVHVRLNPQPWSRTSEGKLVIVRNDIIVVEITRKIRVYEKKEGRNTYTIHEYEGRAIINLSNPESLFEYEEDEIGPESEMSSEPEQPTDSEASTEGS